MPRRPRGSTLYDGCFAHIYSRALEKRFVFRTRDDFVCFKSMLWATKQEFEYRLHHYCLMNTHFHLVVSINNLNLFSKALKELKQGFAKVYKDKHRKSGPVWWGRFGSQLIENERYLYACGLYIEMNPVKAGMTAKPEEWQHSSSRHYFLGQKDKLIDAYERPSYGSIKALCDGLNVGRGSYIGSPLFLLNRGKK